MNEVLQSIASMRQVTVVGGTRIQVADSVAFGSAKNAGDIVVCGSHGGRSAGEYARRFGYGALIANDAGIGLRQAGIAGLAALDEHDVPGVGVASTSARIGDGDDTWDHGIVSFANHTAVHLGVEIGQLARDAALRIARGLEERR